MSVISPYLVIPFVSWLIAQSLKISLKAFKGDFSWSYFYKTGDMPSSHAATVISLLVVLGFINGVASAEFGIAAVFSLLVIHDAMGVRRAVGEQGGVLKRLVEISTTPKDERESFTIREVLGHKPIEVFAGSALGWLVATVLMYSYWPEWAKLLIKETNSTERYIFGSFFVVMLTTGIIINRYYSRKKYHKLPTGKRIRRVVRNTIIVPALMGTIVLWLENESVRFFSNKVWLTGSLVWVVAGSIYVYAKVLKGAKENLNKESRYFSRLKRAIRKKRRRSKKRRR